MFVCTLRARVCDLGACVRVCVCVGVWVCVYVCWVKLGPCHVSCEVRKSVQLGVFSCRLPGRCYLAALAFLEPFRGAYVLIIERMSL